jgi:hypothetical protein
MTFLPVEDNSELEGARRGWLRTFAIPTGGRIEFGARFAEFPPNLTLGHRVSDITQRGQAPRATGTFYLGCDGS